MKRQLSIEYIAPGKLNPAAYNPRKISPQEFQRLCRSIREFGFIEPAVVRKDGVIIGGHQRVKAAMEVGLEKIPVLRRTGIGGNPNGDGNGVGRERVQGIPEGNAE